MNGQLVKSLLVEIDASTEKLRRALREGGVELDTFAQKSTKASTTSSTAASGVAEKHAAAARQIAMVTETVARQGQVSGEAAKQLIAQASNVAFAFGPQGALVGAIGIATLAIGTMFGRARRELEETARAARDEFRSLSEMDLGAISRRLQQLDTGDYRLREALAGRSSLMTRDEALAYARDDRTVLGEQGLLEERARLVAQRERLRSGVEAERRAGAAGSAGAGAVVASEASEARRQLSAEIQALDEALAQLRPRLKAARDLYQERVAITGDQAASQLSTWQAGARDKADGEAERDAERRVTEGFRRASAAVDQAMGDFQRTSEDYEKRFAAVVASGFTGSLADITQAFLALRNEAIRRGETDRIPILDAAREKAVALASQLASTQNLLRDFADEDFDARVSRAMAVDLRAPAADRSAADLRREEEQALRRDEERLRLLRQQLTNLRAAGASREDQLQVLAQIEAIEQRHAKTQQAIQRSVADQARELQQVLDGVLQIAGAWGSVDANVVSALRGVVQMASAVPGIGDKLKAFKAAQKGGEAGGTLMAGLGVAGAALPFIGGLASVASSVFGTSPEERERKRIQRENTQAIRDLTKRVGSEGINLSGRDYLGAGAEVARLLGALGPIPGVGAGFKLNRTELGKQFDFSLLDKAAAELGITLDGTVGSFQKLLAAIEAVEGKLGEFGDSLEEQQAVTDVLIDARQITDPIERLIAKTNPAASLSPIIKQLLAGADLSTAAGREALRAQIIAILETMQAGGDALLESEMGITRDQILATIQTILAGLGEIEAAVPSTGSSLGGISGFRGLTEAAGERMADYLKAMLGQGDDHLQVLRAQLAELTRIASTPFTLPAIPGVTVPVLGSGVGGAVVIEQVRIDIGGIGGITVRVDGGAGVDGEAIAGVALDSFAARVEQVMYDAIMRAKRVGGDLSITPRLR